MPGSEQATQGDYVDLAAPGVEILTLAPGGRQPLTSGTSFATAFVSGGAALLLELFGEVAPAELRRALFSSAEDLGARGRDASYRWGLIDLCRASRELGGRGCQR